jgi:DNA-binding LacI/PurR family transcriptional regulator
VAEFLLAGGHRRIAHVAGWKAILDRRDRARGFAPALAAGGPGAVCRGGRDVRREWRRAAARALMAAADRPDAVFVGNDHMAFAVIDVLRFELGLDVPGDVSVVGYDDVPPAAWPAYDLTTVRQPSTGWSQATVDILLTRDRPGRRRPAVSPSRRR